MKKTEHFQILDHRLQNNIADLKVAITYIKKKTFQQHTNDS